MTRCIFLGLQEDREHHNRRKPRYALLAIRGVLLAELLPPERKSRALALGRAPTLLADCVCVFLSHLLPLVLAPQCWGCSWGAFKGTQSCTGTLLVQDQQIFLTLASRHTSPRQKSTFLACHTFQTLMCCSPVPVLAQSPATDRLGINYCHIKGPGQWRTLLMTSKSYISPFS